MLLYDCERLKRLVHASLLQDKADAENETLKAQSDRLHYVRLSATDLTRDGW